MCWEAAAETEDVCVCGYERGGRCQEREVGRRPDLSSSVAASHGGAARLFSSDPRTCENGLRCFTSAKSRVSIKCEVSFKQTFEKSGNRKHIFGLFTVAVLERMRCDGRAAGRRR